MEEKKHASTLRLVHLLSLYKPIEEVCEQHVVIEAELFHGEGSISVAFIHKLQQEELHNRFEESSTGVSLILFFLLTV